ncbi:MAG: hypothetical protein PHH93_00055 [Prolixibacteraceae bacterium]|nr:hypothetical protein [Prolixibacteraceae bacterium]
MDGKRKFIVLAVIILLLLAGWSVDYVRTQDFTIEILSISPNPGIADGQTPVNIQLRVVRKGIPCEDHILYGVSFNGGSFRAKRVTTDEDGIATFVYYPYLKSKLNELTDATLRFVDESNSLFIAVPAELKMVLPMVEQGGDNSYDQTNEDMFD